MTSLTFGTIGTNWITDSWIDAAHKSGGWKLAAIYSRTQETARAFGLKHQCTNVYTDLKNFIKSDSIQAVYVASPNSLHYEQAQLILGAGKHCILEKPATSTPEQLDELFEIAEKEGVYLIEAYRHIQEANFKRLQQQLLVENRLGRIYGASLSYASFSSRYVNVLNGETPNIFSLQFAGGSLVDVGVYPVTFAVALFGAPLSQVYVPFLAQTGVDGGGVIVLRYEEFGVMINNSKGYTSTAPCEIYGEAGTIAFNGTTDISTMTHSNPQSKTVEDFAGQCMRVDKPNVNMQEEAAEFARIILHADKTAMARLRDISRIVIKVTTDLRRQNGIFYPADRCGGLVARQ